MARSHAFSPYEVLLKKSVAVYRLAFGQPRQDDLLAWLSGLDEALTTDEMDALQIRLEPPAD